MAHVGAGRNAVNVGQCLADFVQIWLILAEVRPMLAKFAPANQVFDRDIGLLLDIIKVRTFLPRHRERTLIFAGTTLGGASEHHKGMFGSTFGTSGGPTLESSTLWVSPKRGEQMDPCSKGAWESRRLRPASASQGSVLDENCSGRENWCC